MRSKSSGTAWRGPPWTRNGPRRRRIPPPGATPPSSGRWPATPPPTARGCVTQLDGAVALRRPGEAEPLELPGYQVGNVDHERGEIHVLGDRELVRHDLDGAALGSVPLWGDVLASTRVGDAVALRLDALQRDHCALLREVWDEVPVSWSDGEARVEPRPAARACAAAPPAGP